MIGRKFHNHEMVKLNGEWHKVIRADGAIAEVAPVDENAKPIIAKKFVAHIDELEK